MAQSCANPGCTANGTKTCTRCRQSSYCSKLCQKENWPQHKVSCQPPPGSSEPKNDNESIQCVKIYGGGGGGGGRYEDVHLSSSHPVFQTDPLPISVQLGYPLVMHRIVPNLARGVETDNVHATWLMIDPVSGFAPAAWQGGIGSVYVARPDRTPLTQAVLLGITDWLSFILDAFGEMPPEKIARIYYGKANLGRYLVQQGIW